MNLGMLKTPEINRHTLPPGGWRFLQPQTGWQAPTPTSSTFNQTVMLIIKHRLGNPALVAKHKLATDVVSVGNELENFTRLRLGVPNPVPKSSPLRKLANTGGAAVAAAGSVAAGIKRAAAGTAVVLDWLESGGAPVPQELADKRASICVQCSRNVPGSWYTVAPAEIIRATLSKRSDVKLETPHDEQLKSCDVCKCLNRLKVWCPMEHIVSRTKPEIMAEFPAHCWIARRDQ